MLESSLLRSRRFKRGNAARNVPAYRNILPPGLINDGEICFAGEQAVDLDEVGAFLFLLVYGPARLICSCHCNGVRPDRRLAIEYRAPEVDVWRDEMLCRQLRSKFVGVRRPKHFPDSSHAVCDVKRKRAIESRSMHVHVPQARNQILARRIDNLSPSWRIYALAVFDFGNAFARNHNGLVARFAARLRVNYSHMGDVGRSGVALSCSGFRHQLLCDDKGAM